MCTLLVLHLPCQTEAPGDVAVQTADPAVGSKSSADDGDSSARVQATITRAVSDCWTHEHWKLSPLCSHTKQQWVTTPRRSNPCTTAPQPFAALHALCHNALRRQHAWLSASQVACMVTHCISSPAYYAPARPDHVSLIVAPLQTKVLEAARQALKADVQSNVGPSSTGPGSAGQRWAAATRLLGQATSFHVHRAPHNSCCNIAAGPGSLQCTVVAA